MNVDATVLRRARSLMDCQPVPAFLYQWPLELVPPSHPALYETAALWDGAPSELEQIARRLFEIMGRPDNPGIGIAAPQVGLSLRLFVLSLESLRFRVFEHAIVCINPEVECAGGKQVSELEGCLTVPGRKQFVRRPKWVRVRYTSLDGSIVRTRFAGTLARAYQHELDHLNGKTIWGRAA